MKVNLMLMSSALAALAAGACGGDTTLQAIDGPGEGGAGSAQGPSTSSSTSTTGPGGSGGSGASASFGPTLMVTHEDGMTAFYNVADDGPIHAHTAFSLPAGVPRAVTQIGPHIVLALAGQGSEVLLRQYDHFVDQANFGYTDWTLQLDPIGASSQHAGPLDHDAEGGLWMLSTGITIDVGIPSNGLHWSPTGSVGGPWSVYEATPAIESWAVLPGARSAMVSTGDGLKQLALNRGDKTITELADPPGQANYPALQVHKRSLYGITVNCPGCTGSGQLHIWRNLEPGEPFDPPPVLGAPDVVISLPEEAATACSLAVGDQGVIIGACRSDIQLPHDPMLYLFREPEALTSSSVVTTSLALPENPYGLAAYHGTTITGANLSVFVRTDATAGPIYDDRQGDLAATGDSFGTHSNPPSVPSDITIVD